MAVFRPRTLLGAVLVAGAFSSLAAQKKKDAFDPPRPRVAAGEDSNSAASYQLLGMQRLSKRPDEAAAAFHWAHRLDPSLADAFYAERIARLLLDSRQLGDYIVRNRGVLRRKEIMQIDSLQIEALIRNPMLNPRLDKVMYELWVAEVTGGETIDWDRSDPASAGWLALSRGDYAKAAQSYAKAIKEDKKSYGLHLNRALALYYGGQLDSSIVSMQAYIDARNADEKKEIVFVYQNKALAEYSIGFVYERLGKPDKAKEAYGRALAEDLAFAAAHVALADIAQNARDTATALQEFDLAVQLRSEDAQLRLRYGGALLQAGRAEDAVTHLEKAVELEPYYAMPWFLLGQAAEKTGKKERALSAYGTFLARAPADRRQLLDQAGARVKVLKGGA